MIVFLCGKPDMKFVKLTFTETEDDGSSVNIWVNMDTVNCIRLSGDGTHTQIYEIGDDDVPFEVKETPEQIMALIADPATSRFLDSRRALETPPSADVPR